MSRAPPDTSLPTTCRMSHGARNWPFFTLTARPVAAAASSKSVWRQRNAGICSTSTTSATVAAWSLSCTSVSTGTPTSSLTRCRFLRPASIGWPRKASMDVRLALSKEDLKISGTPRRSQTSRMSLAILRVKSSDSMTHGPPISASGQSSPTCRVSVIWLRIMIGALSSVLTRGGRRSGPIRPYGVGGKNIHLMTAATSARTRGLNSPIIQFRTPCISARNPSKRLSSCSSR